MRPSLCESPSASMVTMTEVAERVGHELAAIADAVNNLQSLISPLVLEAAARNPAHLRDLQDFDHIAQKLGNLGNYVMALAANIPSHWVVDPTTASRVVTLSALSSRLGFNEKADAAAADSEGDFELF